jgi:adenosyl cobinamide kinase/adenosyl cobinamide phosphate guanylyltransferase
MAERIRQHRARRPAEWETVEEPLDLETALGSIPAGTTTLVDCLTLWVSNLIAQGLSNDEIEKRAHAAAKLASGRTADTIVVSNEVGSGIVPINALARRYRDLLGRVNSIWADASDRSALVVAGRLFPLSRPDELWGSR